MGLRTRLRTTRKKAGSAIVQGFFAGASRVGKMHPLSRPERHGVEVERDIAYLAESHHAEHRLDVYRPRDAGPGPG